ncbi:dihydrolipoamide acetyltransferase family protein [Pseudogracilibacillus auburnensis]|uniref:Dihydrolipoamide acetyltransferase component of pyruvate dehydrogenase complex n=1 Tax=Pseudogracilibacillus auburnensis TaxID=1494959 RepID=A0A2V3VVP6_9BACI|nr:dihydrolipoamide acetyltransferase family protein [Pseudogracilibacillus auburnensis]MBO1004322.1 2-oxo acid dehydrogenase subunit E2 [Pseudogracilibacillus auburnensis]PXW85074.1 2-oxoisovalerate dehydrogenase E2 component (dihydrolipoyl transacylase) [Pseudogracilibacillus auburnensis]
MSLEKIIMPKLGESVTEGTINSWLVKVGDTVNKYDPIAEVMTDKVNAEIPSSFSGVIKEIVVEEGETVAVDELICYIEVSNGSNSVNDSDEEIVQQTGEVPATAAEVDNEQSMKLRYSPAVLKRAAEHQIDLTDVTGTGIGGRITRKDIDAYISKGLGKSSHSKVNEEKAARQINQTLSKKDIEIPVTGVRKMIAENMVRSKQEIPHAWMTVETDVTELVKYRNEIKDDFKRREGYSLTYFAFFIHAIARALREYPEINSTWAGNKIIQRHDINISIAVAKENELFVPVIKHADEKSVKGIAREIFELANKARSGKLTQNDMEGGTFTVNNTGTFGSVSSMGIINHPQAAILQVEAIIKRPVIIKDMFAARDMVNLSLSLDHRILDGLICGRFLARVKQLLENINEQTTTV